MNKMFIWILPLALLITPGMMVNAQCPDGKPCRLSVPKPKRVRKDKEAGITLPVGPPPADPPSSGLHPFTGRQPNQQYVGLHITVRDEKGKPWTNAEVGLADKFGTTWVGNSVGFKLIPHGGSTYGGKTKFTDVPCERTLRLYVFFVSISGHLWASSPYDFKLRCQEGTREMFFVLKRWPSVQ